MKLMIEGKVAIVTGGGRGLGKCIALTLAREGAKVAVLGRTLETIEQTVREIKAIGREGQAIRMDVSQNVQVKESVQKVLATWGKIDILVNNAAAISRLTSDPDPYNKNPFLDLIDERWEEEIAVNLTGVFYCMRAVISQMIAQRSGRIINIGSLAGVNGGYFASPSYSSAKAGIKGMSMLAARWLGKYGINVNVVNPGPIQTEGAAFGQAQLEALGKMIPFRRDGIETEILGTPQDIANAVLFLASDLSSYITGICINVIGGQHMG